MTTAARLPLAADRWTPCARTISFDGYDLTGATMRLQVRLRPDTPGAPLIDLATVTSASAEGLKLLGVDTSSGHPVSTVSLRIDESTMESLPPAAELGADLVLAWDLVVTPAGGLKERWLFGDFIVQAGVTQ